MLRDDVTFHDGRAVRRRGRQGELRPHRRPGDGIRTGREHARRRVLCGHRGRRRAHRAGVLHPAYAPFLQAASTALLGFYSPAVLESSADQLKAGGPGITVGTGPFEPHRCTRPTRRSSTPATPITRGARTTAGARSRDTARRASLPEAAVRVGRRSEAVRRIAQPAAAERVADLADAATVDAGIPGCRLCCT